jgi:CHAT domain-containing protein
VAASGTSEHGRALPPVPETAREAGEIGRLFQHAVILTGADATAQNVGSAAAAAEIFHFAGHHGDAGLLLAAGSDGIPRPLDLRAFAPSGYSSCRLAVLSACQTSAIAWGDEWDPDTLVRTLHRYGVPAVVASRWSVDSERTADFMKLFYATLLGGSSVDRALQQASAALRARPEAAHPYYWAAFASFE